MISEEHFAREVVQRLQHAGFVAFWAGGCVRDRLLGLTPHDYDVATSATPAQVRQLFPRTIAVGESFGVIEVLGPKPLHVQVATFRADGPYEDGRRPVSVEYSTAEEDARRRDFTINGMFWDPLASAGAGQLIDYVGGEGDLKNKVLRAIGEPEERFREDKLRMLRAVRFSARFDLPIEPRTRQAIVGMADQLAVVSAERITDELKKMLVHPSRFQALTEIYALGLAAAFLPEVSRDDFLENWQGVDLPALNDQSFVVTLAVWLRSLREADGVRPPQQRVYRIAQRWKLSNPERDALAWLVEQQDRLPKWGTDPWSHWHPIVTNKWFTQLVAFCQAVYPHNQKVADLLAEIDHRRVSGRFDPAPFLTGEDLLQMGMPAGPQVKHWLQFARNQQLDEIWLSRDESLEKLREIVKR